MKTKKTMNNPSTEIVLVIAAHFDDEVLGMGGTIAKHIANGIPVYCISMTNGVTSRANSTQQQIESRKEASLNASKILGFTWYKSFNFPDNAMDTIPLLSVIKSIEEIKNLLNPTIIYTHSTADLNIDHRIVSQATLTAFRPQPNEKWNEIRTFEIPSSTEYGHKSITNSFSPNLFVDISSAWGKKLKALSEYSLEMRPHPHARSIQGIENLAKLRGNQSGLCYAEAFEIIRKIIRE